MVHLARDVLSDRVYAVKLFTLPTEEDKKTSLERLRIELSGTAEEYAAMQAEKAKEERWSLCLRFR